MPSRQSRVTSTNNRKLATKWINNAMKSIGSSSVSVFKSMAPEISESAKEIKSTADATFKAMKNMTSMNKMNNQMNKNKVILYGKKAIENALDDLKHGNFNNETREMDTMFNAFDDINSSSEGAVTFNYIDDSEERVNEAASLRESINKSTEANLRASKATIDTMITVSNVGLLQNQQIAGDILSRLDNINNNISAMLEYHQQNTTKFYEASLALYDKLGERIDNKQKSTSDKEDDQDLFKYGGRLNIAEYKQYAKKNLVNKFKGTSVGASIDQLLNNETTLQMLASNPLGLVSTMAITSVIPGAVKEAVTGLEDTFKNFVPTFLSQLNDWGNRDGAGFVQKFIANAFGINIKAKNNIGNISDKINKEAATFDGITRNSIIEVIPKYLRESTTYLKVMAEAMTGRKNILDEMEVFDHNTNRYKKKSDLTKDLMESITDSIKEGFNGTEFARSFNRSIDNAAQNGKDINKVMNDLLMNLVSNDIKSKDIQELTHFGGKNNTNKLNSLVRNMRASGGYSKTELDLIEEFLLAAAKDGKIWGSFAGGKAIASNNLNRRYKEISDNYDMNNLVTLGIDENTNMARYHAQATGNKGALRQFEIEDKIAARKAAKEEAERKKNAKGKSAKDIINEGIYGSITGGPASLTSSVPADYTSLIDFITGTGKHLQNSMLSIMANDPKTAMKEFSAIFSDQIKNLMNVAKEGFFKPLAQQLFGSRDANGNSVDGIFSKMQNKISDTWKSIGYMINGKEYTDSKNVKHVDKQGSEDTLIGKISSTFHTMTDSLYYRLFGKSKEDDDKGVFGHLAESITYGLNGWKNIIFGKDPDAEQSVTIEYIKKKAAEVAPDTIIGTSVGAISGAAAGGSLLGTLVGGPIGGAVLGFAGSFLSRSNKFKDYLFGPEDEDGNRLGGLISRKTQEAFNDPKLKRSAIGGAALGFIKSMVFGGPGGLLGTLVGGPIGGALIGTGIGIIKESNMWKTFLYGDPEKGKTGILDMFKKVKLSSDSDDENGTDSGIMKSLGMAGIGALGGGITAALIGKVGLLGATLTPAGPIGGAILGMAIGIKSQGKKFREWLFGAKDEEGNRTKTGMIGKLGNMLHVEVIAPMRDRLADMLDDAKLTFEYKILENIRLSFIPLTEAISGIKDRVTDGIVNAANKFGDFLMNIAEKKFLEPFAKTVITPIRKVIGGLTNLIYQGTKAIVTTPFVLVGKAVAATQSFLFKGIKSLNRGILNIAKGAFKVATKPFGWIASQLNKFILSPIGSGLQWVGNKANNAANAISIGYDRLLGSRNRRDGEDYNSQRRNSLTEFHQRRAEIKEERNNRRNLDKNRRKAARLLGYDVKYFTEETMAKAEEEAKKKNKHITWAGKMSKNQSDLSDFDSQIQAQRDILKNSTNDADRERAASEIKRLKNERATFRNKFFDNDPEAMRRDQLRSNTDAEIASMSDQELANMPAEVRIIGGVERIHNTLGNIRDLLMDKVGKFKNKRRRNRNNTESGTNEPNTDEFDEYTENLLNQQLNQNSDDASLNSTDENSPRSWKDSLKNFKNKLSSFLSDEDGQGTPEYIFNMITLGLPQLLKRIPIGNFVSNTKNKISNTKNRIGGFIGGMLSANTIRNAGNSDAEYDENGNLKSSKEGSNDSPFDGLDTSNMNQAELEAIANARKYEAKEEAEVNELNDARNSGSYKTRTLAQEQAKREAEKDAKNEAHQNAILSEVKSQGEENKKFHIDWSSIFSKKGLITAGLLAIAPTIIKHLPDIIKGLKTFIENTGAGIVNAANALGLWTGNNGDHNTNGESSAERFSSNMDRLSRTGKDIAGLHFGKAAKDFVLDEDDNWNNQSKNRSMLVTKTANKAVKIGGKVVRGGSKAIGGLKKAGSFIGNKFLNHAVKHEGSLSYKIAEKGVDIFGHAGGAKGVVKDSLKATGGKFKNIASKIASKGAAVVEKSAANGGLLSKVLGMLDDFVNLFAKKLGKKAVEKGAESAFKAGARGLITSTKEIISKSFSKVSAKIAAVFGTKASAGAATLGLSEAIFIGIGAIDGATAAAKLFKIPKDSVDGFMVAISTIIGGFEGSTIGSIIAIINDLIASINQMDFISAIATLAYTILAGKTKGDKLSTAQSNFNKQYEEYRDRETEKQYNSLKKTGAIPENVTYEDFLADINKENSQYKHLLSYKSFSDYNTDKNASIIDKAGKGIVSGAKTTGRFLMGTTVYTDPDTGITYTKNKDGTYQAKSSSGEDLGYVSKNAIPESALKNGKTKGGVLRPVVGGISKAAKFTGKALKSAWGVTKSVAKTAGNIAIKAGKIAFDISPLGQAKRLLLGSGKTVYFASDGGYYNTKGEYFTSAGIPIITKSISKEELQELITRGLVVEGKEPSGIKKVGSIAKLATTTLSKGISTAWTNMKSIAKGIIDSPICKFVADKIANSRLGRFIGGTVNVAKNFLIGSGDKVYFANDGGWYNSEGQYFTHSGDHLSSLDITTEELSELMKRGIVKEGKEPSGLSKKANDAIASIKNAASKAWGGLKSFGKGLKGTVSATIDFGKKIYESIKENGFFGSINNALFKREETEGWFATDGSYYTKNEDGSYNHYTASHDLIEENLSGDDAKAINRMIQSGQLKRDTILLDTKAEEALKKIKDTLGDMWQNAADHIGDFIENSGVADTAKGIGSKAKDAVSAIGNFFGFGGFGDKKLSKLSDITDESEIGGFGKSDLINGFKYYSQKDKRWGKQAYSSNNDNETIGSAGCGPTSMAMVASQLSGRNITPDVAARDAKSGGFRDSTGTNSGYFDYAANKYGLKENKINNPTSSSIKSELNKGNPVILNGINNESISGSPYTRKGHYVVAYGTDSNGNILINDPRGKKYSGAYTPNMIDKQTRIGWSFRNNRGYGGYGPLNPNNMTDSERALYGSLMSRNIAASNVSKGSSVDITNMTDSQKSLYGSITSRNIAASNVNASTGKNKNKKKKSVTNEFLDTVNGANSTWNWLTCVKTVKAAIADASAKKGYDTSEGGSNSAYNQGGFIDITVNGKNIKARRDCSGYVSACLIAYGIKDSNYINTSTGFCNPDSKITDLGFTKLRFGSWSDCKIGDIVTHSGHVEIFAGFDDSGVPKVWSNGCSKSVLNPNEETTNRNTSHTVILRPPENGDGTNSYSSDGLSYSSNDASIDSSGPSSALDILSNAFSQYATKASNYILTGNYDDHFDFSGISGSSSSSDSGSSTNSSINTSNIKGDNYKEKIWNFLTTQAGLSPEAAAGPMGCWEAESNNNPYTIEGYYLNGGSREQTTPSIIKDNASLDYFTRNTLFPAYAKNGVSINQSAYLGKDGHLYPGLGLAQWTGDRGKRLKQYADANGLDWGTLEGQLGYFMNGEGEFNSRSSLKNALSSVTNPEDAATAFLDGYEMYSGWHNTSTGSKQNSVRRANARSIYNLYKNKNTGAGGFGDDMDDTGVSIKSNTVPKFDMSMLDKLESSDNVGGFGISDSNNVFRNNKSTRVNNTNMNINNISTEKMEQLLEKVLEVLGSIDSNTDKSVKSLNKLGADGNKAIVTNIKNTSINGGTTVNKTTNNQTFTKRNTRNDRLAQQIASGR